MLAKLDAFSLLGIGAVPVDVEVDVSQAAMPKTILVGLPEAAAFFAGHIDIDPVPSRLQELFNTLSHDDDDSDVRGQELAKHALVIAAAGAHNLLMLGPPGSGKTKYMARHPTIDPAALPRSDILSVFTQRFSSHTVP